MIELSGFRPARDLSKSRAQIVTEAEIFASLHEIFCEIFIRDDISLENETTAADVEGWDSFKQIEILLAVEERMGVKLKTREIDGLKSVGDLVRTIQSKNG
jgi:acyl carrier protein